MPVVELFPCLSTLWSRSAVWGIAIAMESRASAIWKEVIFNCCNLPSNGGLVFSLGSIKRLRNRLPEALSDFINAEHPGYARPPTCGVSSVYRTGAFWRDIVCEFFNIGQGYEIGGKGKKLGAMCSIYFSLPPEKQQWHVFSLLFPSSGINAPFYELYIIDIHNWRLKGEKPCRFRLQYLLVSPFPCSYLLVVNPTATPKRWPKPVLSPSLIAFQTTFMHVSAGIVCMWLCCSHLFHRPLVRYHLITAFSVGVFLEQEGAASPYFLAHGR